ncbi:MAG: NUDIX domain-containing protein [Candidatus Staskawiczbacteria bacterium]|nr:NUDIX domain-containing protein [Candidatus Staskawiczbacteria bacterium]
MEEKPKVGVGVMILNNRGEVLLGKRIDDPIKASSDLHGEGCWTMPGGKLEFQETLIDGAIREVLEETGIKLDKEKTSLISITDELRPDTHYVTAGFLCRDFVGEPKATEPEEITEWKWYNLNKLPDNVFLPSAKIIKAYLSGRIYN